MDLAEKKLDEFIKFSKEKSLTFLQELDEWLRSNSDGGKKRCVRAGIGLFSYSQK